MPNIINTLIINWYEENKRDLPWRNTTNPYKIWLSEIILQQTRVQQGLDYFNKFVKNFPTLSDLAVADEQEILRNWQGLGYYSRARNLHKAAKIIHFEQNGIFPDSYDKIIQLPGIGDYTAAAISSFAFQEQQAVLDGNVYRVLSRIFNLSIPIDSTQGKKKFRALAQEFLNKENPSTHNQAIMELGALICSPQSPNCAECPIILHCEAYRQKTYLDLPVKEKKTKVRNRRMSFLLLHQDNQVAVMRRKEKDIWQHLHQFPVIDEHDYSEAEMQQKFEDTYKMQLSHFLKFETKTHLLSHQRLSLDFYIGQSDTKINAEDVFYVDLHQLDDLPFPRPLVEFIRVNLPMLISN